MKLKLKLIGLILVCISLFNPLQTKAQSKDTVTKTTVYNDVKSIITTSDARVSKAINTLAKELKITTDKVWDILVKQQKVWSIAFLIAELLSIWCWVHFWYRFKVGQDNHWGDPNDGSYTFSCIITFFIAVLFSIISVIHFTDMLTGFINPEYGAMKTIVEVTQSLK